MARGERGGLVVRRRRPLAGGAGADADGVAAGGGLRPGAGGAATGGAGDGGGDGSGGDGARPAGVHRDERERLGARAARVGRGDGEGAGGDRRAARGVVLLQVHERGVGHRGALRRLFGGEQSIWLRGGAPDAQRHRMAVARPLPVTGRGDWTGAAGRWTRSAQLRREFQKERR